MTRVRLAATAAALLSPLLLAGCGIKPTGPIDSGAAAIVVVPAPSTAALVYFVSPEGRLVPSPIKDSDRPPVVQVVNRLLAGPDPEERAAGLTTQLPSVSGRRLEAPAIGDASSQVVTVWLPFHVGDLTPTARRQLVCTVGSTGGPEERIRVAFKGTDGSSLEASDCDVGRLAG